jgi:hypothetical protein
MKTLEQTNNVVIMEKRNFMLGKSHAFCKDVLTEVCVSVNAINYSGYRLLIGKFGCHFTAYIFRDDKCVNIVWTYSSDYNKVREDALIKVHALLCRKKRTCKQKAA